VPPLPPLLLLLLPDEAPPPAPPLLAYPGLPGPLPHASKARPRTQGAHALVVIAILRSVAMLQVQLVYALWRNCCGDAV
jgi:hypothetical protein